MAATDFHFARVVPPQTISSCTVRCSSVSLITIATISWQVNSYLEVFGTCVYSHLKWRYTGQARVIIMYNLFALGIYY